MKSGRLMCCVSCSVHGYLIYNSTAPRVHDTLHSEYQILIVPNMSALLPCRYASDTDVNLWRELRLHCVELPYNKLLLPLPAFTIYLKTWLSLLLVLFVLVSVSFAPSNQGPLLYKEHEALIRTSATKLFVLYKYFTRILNLFWNIYFCNQQPIQKII